MWMLPTLRLESQCSSLRVVSLLTMSPCGKKSTDDLCTCGEAFRFKKHDTILPFHASYRVQRGYEAYTLFLMMSFFCCTEWGLHGLKRTKCSAVRSRTSPTTGGSFFPDTDTSSSAICWPSPGEQTHIIEPGGGSNIQISTFHLTLEELQSIIFHRLRRFSDHWKDLPSMEMSFTWQLSHTTVKTWQLFSAVVGKKTTCKHTYLNFDSAA